MMSNNALFFGALVLGICTATIYGMSSMLQRRRLCNRQDTNSGVLISRSHYRETQIPNHLARELIAEAEAILRVPAGKLRPTDKLGADVGRGFVVTPEMDALFQVGSTRLQAVGISRIEAEKLLEKAETVDDYIQIIGTRTSNFLE